MAATAIELLLGQTARRIIRPHGFFHDPAISSKGTGETNIRMSAADSFDGLARRAARTPGGNDSQQDLLL
jgi:hypothetical protein